MLLGLRVWSVLVLCLQENKKTCSRKYKKISFYILIDRNLCNVFLKNAVIVSYVLFFFAVVIRVLQVLIFFLLFLRTGVTAFFFLRQLSKIFT